MARSSEAGIGDGRVSSLGDGSGEAVGVTVDDDSGLRPDELLGRRRLRVEGRGGQVSQGEEKKGQRVSEVRVSQRGHVLHWKQKARVGGK